MLSVSGQDAEQGNQTLNSIFLVLVINRMATILGVTFRDSTTFSSSVFHIKTINSKNVLLPSAGA